MPNLLIKTTAYSNFSIEVSFLNESPLDHQNKMTNENSLDVQSPFVVRCIESARNSKNSACYEVWRKEFGPLKTPGLKYWNNYEPIATFFFKFNIHSRWSSK